MAPGYPGFEVEVEALRADPSLIEKLTIDSVADHYLLDRGLGAAALAIDSALVRGIRRVPLSQVRSLFTALDNPAHRHQAVPFTPEQFHYAFTDVMSKEESQKVYDRYHIPAPGRIIWDGALANFQPHSEAKVDFKRPGRAPLLFIAGSEDHIMPASVNKANYKLQLKNDSVTNYTEFAGRCHYTCGQDGWEPVADYALAWASHQISSKA
jgi:pimeloyl-ACP methyl ester carboxylesterase